MGTTNLYPNSRDEALCLRSYYTNNTGRMLTFVGIEWLVEVGAINGGAGTTYGTKRDWLPTMVNPASGIDCQIVLNVEQGCSLCEFKAWLIDDQGRRHLADVTLVSQEQLDKEAQWAAREKEKDEREGSFGARCEQAELERISRGEQ